MLQILSMGEVKVESDCAVVLFMRVNTRLRFMVGIEYKSFTLL